VATIRALLPTDDRSRFASGDVDLDRFFQRYAGQNQFRHHIGTTYIATDDAGGILGYANVSGGALEVDELPATVQKKLPHYPMPILRLARLAVDGSAQGQGVGTALLRFVLRLVVEMAKQFGCVGVVVDAKPGALKFYAGFGFEEIELVEGESPARPRPTALFLSSKDILAAQK
jgi:GNAT superfamily N-acetyltransferase